MNYKMMVPPIEVGNFVDLSKKQAEIHFNWYLNEIPFRLSQLEKYANESKSKIVFNQEPYSLIAIWKWFENLITVEKKSKREIEKELSQYPIWLHDSIVENNEKFSSETLILGMDISIYFAQTFIKNNPSIHWGYFTKPKKRASVNKPVLLGFCGEQDLDPREIVLNCMRKSLREKDENMLLNFYNVWKNEITPK